MRKVTIGIKLPHPLYIPKVLIEDGFVGVTRMWDSATAIVIAHPKASMEEIKKGLEIILEEVKLRLSD